MRPNRLTGHTLPNEGQVYDRYGCRLAVGATRCSCGVESPELNSIAARRRWHRDHKAAVRATTHVLMFST